MTRLQKKKVGAAVVSASLLLSLVTGCTQNASSLLGPATASDPAVAVTKTSAATCSLISSGLQLPIRVDAALFEHKDPKVRETVKKITATNVAHQCACIDHIPGMTPERRAAALKQCQ